MEEWVRFALKSAGMSQAELARRMTIDLKRSFDRAAVNKMTKGANVKNGRAISADEMFAISRITKFPVPLEVSQTLAQVKVVGRIGAGQEIEPDDEQVPEDGFYQVDVPFLDVSPLGGQAIAFEVVGESMYPRYDPGDLIICLPRERDPKDVLGRDVAVKTGNGKRYLKVIRSGSQPGLYDLESHNAKTIRDAEVAWVSEVIHVASQGRFITRNRR